MSLRPCLQTIDGGARTTSPRRPDPSAAGAPAAMPLAAVPRGDRPLERHAARTARRHVQEGHRLLADVSRNAIPGGAFRERVLAALRTDGGLATVVDWLRGRGYEVSREGLLAAWVARQPGSPEVSAVPRAAARRRPRR